MCVCECLPCAPHDAARRGTRVRTYLLPRACACARVVCVVCVSVHRLTGIQAVVDDDEETQEETRRHPQTGGLHTGLLVMAKVR